MSNTEQTVDEKMTDIKSINSESEHDAKIPDDYEEKVLNDTWILWYHDPNDLNWDISSYKVVSTIKTIREFWNTYEYIKNSVIENSMFFIMRDGILPLWEDAKNVNGGCWSFKISKGSIKKYWTELSIFLLGENITSGVKLNYHHINSGEFYNSKSILSTDIGFAANLTNELHLGFSLINPTFSKIDDYANERIPTVLQFAAGYHFSSELSLQAGVKKDMIYPLSFITAILYSPNEKVSIRGGVGTNPSLASLGINVHLNQIQLIFATQIHQILGWSPDFGIAYQFN